MHSDTGVPVGVKALTVFFFLATGMALTALVTLLFPGGMLEPIWHVNPQAHERFIGLGGWAFALLSVLALVCAATGIGLWTRRMWGYNLAVGTLTLNLLGDLINGIFWGEAKAFVGVLIVATILAYLMLRRVRRSFR